jgi:hypothetical protein
MQGRRRADGTFPRYELAPGEYGRIKQHDGEWLWIACTPNGMVGDLSQHEVVEHEDGTITVAPSIEVSGGKSVLAPGDDAELMEIRGLTGIWHGFLRAGVWESV